jgi:hypothetical protein
VSIEVAFAEPAEAQSEVHHQAAENEAMGESAKLGLVGEALVEPVPESEAWGGLHENHLPDKGGEFSSGANLTLGLSRLRV